MKTWKWIPVSVYHMAELETWLSHCAGRGCFVHRVGANFASFRKGEPREVRYRLEPIRDRSGPDGEMREAYAQMGWDYVSTVQSFFYLFASNRPDAPELYTDAVVQGESFGYLTSRMRLLLIVSLASVLLLALMILLFLFQGGGPWLNLLDSTRLLHLTLGLFLFFCVVRSFLDYRSIRRLIARLRSGFPMAHRADYRRYIPRRAAWGMLALALMVSYLALGGLMLSRHRLATITPEELPLPYLALDEIEGDGFVYGSASIGDEVNFSRFATYNWSPLAPDICETHQAGVVEGRNWADGSGPYAPTLIIGYYRCTFAPMARPLLRDLIRRAVDPYDDLQHDFLEGTGFDEAQLYTEPGSQLLFARTGKRVVYVRYYGDRNLRDHLPDLLEAVQTYRT